MRTGKLFHTIVIVGASLTSACSGDDTPAPAEDASVSPDTGSTRDSGMMADASMPMEDAGEEQDGMVLIL